MADHIFCAWVTCPKCGAWIVAQGSSIVAGARTNARFLASCFVPECGEQFAFASEDTQTFEVPLSLFERRYFYRSELLISPQKK